MRRSTTSRQHYGGILPIDIKIKRTLLQRTDTHRSWYIAVDKANTQLCTRLELKMRLNRMWQEAQYTKLISQRLTVGNELPVQKGEFAGEFINKSTALFAVHEKLNLSW